MQAASLVKWLRKQQCYRTHQLHLLLEGGGPERHCPLPHAVHLLKYITP